MKLKQEELRKQERNNTQVNEITEGDLIQSFSVTEDQMEKAAVMLGKSIRLQKWKHRQQCRRKGGIFYTYRE